MSELRKDPDVDKTFGINWASYLGSLTITASEWELPSGVTEADSSNTTTTTSIQLSGGTDGEDYELINRVTLSNDDTEEKTIVVQVREASWRLTEDELLALAEITLESDADIETWAADFTVNKASYLRTEIVLWNENRNDVDLELRAGAGGGVDLNSQRILTAIRERVRISLGLSLYSPETHESSYAVANRFVF